jgi:hypothetical protein
MNQSPRLRQGNRKLQYLEIFVTALLESCAAPWSHSGSRVRSRRPDAKVLLIHIKIFAAG